MGTTRTSPRKQQHIQLALTKDVSFRTKTAGFERWDFQHNALPELNLRDVDPATTFLGKPVALPLIVSSMTGGYADAVRINARLAEVCARKKIAMGVGSQRQALEDARFHRSYTVVREVAGEIPLFGNIGAGEIARLRDPSPVLRLVEMIRADGFAVHLNPLQEFLQPEGNTDFQGVLAGIERLAKSLSVPLIVKEVGAGISYDTARRLRDAGVKIIDVAGAGGTSWAGVEILRGKNKGAGREFWDWGIPTTEAIIAVQPLKSGPHPVSVIASGGIAGGLDVAKSLALGADFAAAARPVLQSLERGGVRACLKLIGEWERELTGAMFLTGSRTLADLQNQPLIERT